MQPDYNQLWRNMNNGQTPDAQFYALFEDSLNQFISTNSNVAQAANNAVEQNNSDHNVVNAE
ncbi:hypothetical protein FC093_13640 [Ilyomonas limi]|uniref:Uncharacterized protein n=1 Tax=Ilyomonas limi TaxID=2575867 RepID=A0A4U3L2N5_9BACT|nr:hypothetical protein [Ilyomonas limi]TKK67787.1 hypothetical protein FC093_13640 [Ilyomonas limi]